jgi:hypothetical protein
MPCEKRFAVLNTLSFDKYIVLYVQYIYDPIKARLLLYGFQEGHKHSSRKNTDILLTFQQG